MDYTFTSLNFLTLLFSDVVYFLVTHPLTRLARRLRTASMAERKYEITSTGVNVKVRKIDSAVTMVITS